MVNLMDNEAILMLITASDNTRTYMTAECGNSCTTTVELDINPVSTATVPTNVIRKRNKSGGD